MTVNNIPGLNSKKTVFGEQYKSAIFKQFGFINFASYSDYTGENTGTQLEVPLLDIFLPLDFSGYGGQKTLTIDTSKILIDTGSKVILANPGFGKTTFLRFALLNLFNNDVVPVYWEWKYFYNQFQNSPDFSSILTSYFNNLLSEQFDHNDIDAVLKKRRLAFLIDGFDEVEQSGILHKFKDAIEEYKKEHPDNYFMITSRIANYPMEYFDFFSNIGFKHYQINALPDHLIFDYIRRFINYQMSGDSLKSSDKIKFLSKYIDRQPGIKALAAHPLLLSLIVLIYTFEGSLPDTKVNLYERCIDLLIYVWKKSDKDIQIFNQFFLDNSALHALLSEIAFAYFKYFIDGNVNEFGTLSQKELKVILKQSYLQLVRGKKNDRKLNDIIDRLFDYFKNNTGVIVELSPGKFGFSHLSLLEFLAARRIVMDKGDFNSNLDYLLEVMHKLEDQKFRQIEEVFVFQAQLLGKSTSKSKYIDMLAKFLISQFKQEKKPRALVLLAKLLRDNQEFSIHDATEILKLVTIEVARNPENTELYLLLNEIFLLSGETREYFVELLGRSAKEREIWENFSERTGHRIGNKVFGIRSDLNILERELNKIPVQYRSQKIEMKFDKIKSQIHGLNQILGEYRAFASGIDVDYKECDIDELLHKLSRNFAKKYPAINVFYQNLNQKILAFTDKARLEQILEELVEDSIKHSGARSLTIDLSLEAKNGKFIIHYRDNGKGIVNHLKTKIFEPFFSTDSKSTGIGMANIKKIVESLNGDIFEMGEENHGVHFKMSFGIAWRSQNE